MQVSASWSKRILFSVSSATATIGFLSLGLSATAPAQDAAADSASSSGGLEEVVVTARRKEENLQDIPVSVQVVSGEVIQDLLITQPSDLSSLAAGLDLSLPSPTFPVITLRGVRWTIGSGTPATPIYLNEISFDTAPLMQTLYDVGQVEVLRGPQGTARGAPSISGAVTITTRRPDVEEIGGYVQGIAGEHDRRNAQGAVNVPLIDHQLAVRLAGSYDQTSADRVKSLNNPDSPNIENKSGRASVRYTPTETILIDAMYQRLEQSGDYYTAVAGPGSPGFPPNVPPSFNGPEIQSGQYLAVDDGSNRLEDTVEYYTLNASWDITEDYRISYNFGDQHVNPHSATSLDPANVVPGYSVRPTQTAEDPRYYVHEARFSSIRGPDRLFDYDIGYYYQKFDGVSTYDLPVFLDGAFGDPRTAAPGDVTSPVSRYSLFVESDFTIARTLESFYGNLEFHLPYETELTIGLRSIDDKSSSPATLAQSAGWIAFVNPVAPALSCSDLANLSPAAAGAIDSSVYPGLCDLPVPASVTTEGAGDEHDKTIYNVSLSHQFADNVLAYATTGTSYRGGLPSLNNPGLPPELSLPDAETATSYEIGVKTLWNNWLVVNADVFLIDYKDQLYQFQGVPYWNSIAQRESNTGVAFFRNVDAQVIGGEVEITAAPIENLTLTTHLSYASIESEGGDVPCIDPSRPITADNIINSCQIEKGENLNTSPKFQASFLGNYILPLGPFDGYLRTLVSYDTKNPNYGASFEKAPSYTTVDVFAGITGDNGGWDVGLYARNVFNTRVQLGRQAFTNSFYPPFGPNPGYDLISLNAPREIGMTVQYAFGSR